RLAGARGRRDRRLGGRRARPPRRRPTGTMGAVGQGLALALRAPRVRTPPGPAARARARDLLEPVAPVAGGRRPGRRAPAPSWRRLVVPALVARRPLPPAARALPDRAA